MTASQIGIEIGGTKLQLVAGHPDGTILHRQRLQVDRDAGGAGIRRQLEGALPELLALHPGQSIGVGFGGPVNRDAGRIAASHQIEGWSGFPLCDWLRQLTGLPSVIENDANTAALAEAKRGAGVGFDPVFYVTLGSGVGGGLVCEGRIYHGAPPGEAEIGHLRLDSSGVIVEERCSGWAVDRRIRALRTAYPGSRLSALTAGLHSGEARHLAAALAEADVFARRVLEETARHLAFALSHVIHLLHPAAVVLGGGLSLVGDPLREAVAAQLPSFLMEVFHPGPEVRLAALGEDAVPVGALLLAGQRLVGS